MTAVGRPTFEAAVQVHQVVDSVSYGETPMRLRTQSDGLVAIDSTSKIPVGALVPFVAVGKLDRKDSHDVVKLFQTISEWGCYATSVVGDRLVKIMVLGRVANSLRFA
eukprot:3245655-Pyramimonas_sp.AAC.1